jgi:hypothetical protein
MHSQQCDPTGASCRHSEHAGRPQRVHERPVSRSVWWKHVVAVSTATKVGPVAGYGAAPVVVPRRAVADSLARLGARVSV